MSWNVVFTGNVRQKEIESQFIPACDMLTQSGVPSVYLPLSDITPDIYSDDTLFINMEVASIHHLLNLNKPNIHYYGGQTINKDLQLSTLNSHGIPVPKFVTNPTSVSSIFDNLGDTVVVKPVNWFSCRGNNVRIVTRQDHNLSDVDLNRWLFSTYVGEQQFPYWRCRCEVLLGHLITAAVRVNNDETMIVGQSTDRHYEPATNKMITIGTETGMLFTDIFRCAYVGVDIVGCRETEQYYVVEANPTSVCVIPIPDEHLICPMKRSIRIAEAVLSRIVLLSQ